MAVNTMHLSLRRALYIPSLSNGSNGHLSIKWTVHIVEHACVLCTYLLNIVVLLYLSAGGEDYESLKEPIWEHDKQVFPPLLPAEPAAAAALCSCIVFMFTFCCNMQLRHVATESACSNCMLRNIK